MLPCEFCPILTKHELFPRTDLGSFGKRIDSFKHVTIAVTVKPLLSDFL